MPKLVKHPNPILDQVLPDFDFSNPIMPPDELEKTLVETMYSENGIGLAASQIGIKTRVFSIKTRNIPELTEPFAVFNPVVLQISELTECNFEGCLSFPGLYLDVKRPAAIVARFVDRNNISRIIELTGIDARCFLHELDHLDGVCFTDRVSKLKLDIAERKRKKNGRTQQ